MSLVGNLEDLGLGEILQIVSLSRKSGVLQLNRRERDGRVVFREGHVVRAESTSFPENLGDLLLKAGLADLTTLKKALAIQQGTKTNLRIGDILVQDFGVKREDVEEAVREQLEKIVYSFFTWDDGTFSFELGEPEDIESTPLDPLQFMLDKGLNPQWLAMEGTRLLDEKRHRGDLVEEQGRSLVNVNDLLADVKHNAHSVLTDPSNSAVESLQKPVQDTLVDLGEELRQEMGEDTIEYPSQTVQQSPGLHLLRDMLQELNNPSLGGGIILLILRFASELMNRAVILLVRESDIVGLGQFGLEREPDSADRRVRNIRLPIDEPHIFAHALQSSSPVHEIPEDSSWNTYFFEQLGSGQPAEVFVGPLVSEGRVVALLYGDNLPDHSPIGDTETLEIFLSQAGLAMEKALLERRMMNS